MTSMPAPAPPDPACPACTRRGTPSSLRSGAALDGQGCAQCGGVLLTSVGSERLLYEELALSRSTLLEIAQGFGGHRFSCPSCTSKMRPLLVRGVDVDLCFHCGALWLDDGEIERLSALRYRSTPRTVLAPTTTTALVQPESVVRFSAVHPLRRIIGEVVGFNVFAFAGMHLLGFGGERSLIGAVVLAAIYVLNRSRRVVDVFPRARRLLRSKRMLPAGPRDEGSEHLDDVRFVAVRPSWLGVEAALVDSVGRTVVTIAVKSPLGALAEGTRQAPRLGASLLVHPTIAAVATRFSSLTTPTPLATTPLPYAPNAEHVVVVRVISAQGPHLQLDGVRDGRVVWTMRNAVPAQAAERDALQLAFYMALPDGTVFARFHDDGHGHTVVVGADGEALASVRRRRLGPVLLHEIARARSPHRLRLLPIGFNHTLMLDGNMNRHATIVDADPPRLQTRQTGDDEALLAVLLYAHVLIDGLAGMRKR